MKASTIFINILSLASLYLAVSCNEEEQHGQTVSTILATIEQSSTRTALDGPDADGVYKTIWSSDDAIAVFSGSNAASEFKLTSGANTNTAEFEGNAASDNMVAVYPYSIVKGRTGSTISVTLPEVQEYVSGNIPQGAYPMAAVSDGAVLPFYNLCSVLRLRMFGELTVKSITFTPNDASTKASGNATVNAADKMLTMSSDAEATVKLNCVNGVKLTRTSTDFLMVVPAQKYTGGFTITINTDQGAVVKAVKSDVTLSRSVLYPIKTFECKIDHSKDNIVFEDANFKAYMIKNFDTDGDGEISYEEALAITMIDVDTDNIESLAGIEHMANLTELNCEGPFVMSGYEPEEGRGKLKTLDVSKNTKLTKLYCGFNQFSSLDLTSNVLLERLRCAGNDLNNLDVSKNTELTRLTAYNNHLSSIDVSNNTKLEVIDLSNNQIKSIDISKNESLATFNCDDNLLTELDPSNNQKLTNIYCSNNNLSSINVRKNQKLAKLVIIGNSIPQIDLRNNSELTHLFCEKNKISELDLSNNTKLRQLTVNDNSLSSLTVNCCPEIEILNANNNLIKEMDISELIALKYFDCIRNPLETLYIFEGQIDALTEINIPSNTKIVVKGSEEPEDWAGKEFWHKSLGMRFTATWCGYCPMMATSFASAISQYPNRIELLNLHPTSSNLGFNGTSKLENIFKITSFPTGMIDYRSSIANYSNSNYTTKVILDAVKETESNYPVKTGISFSSSVSGNTLNLNVKLYIKEKGDYKVTAVLLEDNIIGYQNGGGNSYNHSGIARVAFTDITGDEVSTSEDNKTVSKNYTATIPSSCDKNNLRVLVYVLRQYGSQTIIRTDNYGDYYVDNAVSAAVGTTQDLVFSDGTIYGGNEGMKDGGEITLK